MTDFVRVKHPGGEATVAAGFAERHGLTVLDKPAVNDRGTALAPKPKTSVATAAEKKSTPKEDTK